MAASHKTVEQLGKLFGSEAQVKCMRLFLHYPNRVFALTEVMEKAKISRAQLRQAIHSLKAVGFCADREVTLKKKLKNGKTQTKKVAGIELKKSYLLIPHLHNLLIGGGVIMPDEVRSLFSPVGKVHMLVLSGLFLGDNDRVVDLLVIGDRIPERALLKAVRTLESEVGHDVRYALFTAEEYQYRMTMYDKLLRDVFDYPNIKVIDKIKK